MKQNIHHLYYLFYPRGLISLRRSGWIIIALLLCNAVMLAQKQTPPNEFVLDGFMNYESLWIDPIYNSYTDCGFNTMTQRATDDSKSLLSNFNLHAVNAQDSLQWIYYYSSAYYSKWEAEEDQQNENKVGVKHSAGEVAYWYDNNDTVLCWSTKGLTGPANTIVYGPTYHQEKWYRRWYDGYEDEDRYNLKYTPRFRMALDINGNVSPDDPVCRIYVILKYCFVGVNEPCTTYSTYTLKEPVTLKVSDFPANGQFDYIYFNNFVEERSYDYPIWTRDPITDKLILPEIEGTYFDDRRGGQGVQFCIDWLRTDTLCTLYIDNIEVYDNNGWNRYLENPFQRALDIKNYADGFKTDGWANIKHWLGGHEPSSIDSYVPIRIVDSLIQDVDAPPLMNTVWAFWTLELNGESQLERYYNMVRPNKLLSEIHPISASYDVVRPFDLEVVRRVLQESYRVTQESGFYFHVQSYGEWDFVNNTWYIWRFPTVPEHKAIIMLALSHGADGLVQAQYDSYPGMKGIIREASENYDTTDIWYSLRDNIFPRIKGKLGTTLLALNYMGDYLYLGRNLEPGPGFENTPETVTKNYLTLSVTDQNPTPITHHYHAVFFGSSNQGDNNHFFLSNLITTGSRWVNVYVGDDGSTYSNTRFRNVEPEYDFDTTFTDVFSIDIQFPPGEGYLYQVAPVGKYGG